MRPRSVLDELLRLGVVEIDADDYVHLVTSGFVPGKELDAKAFYFGEAVHDHLAAGAHNLEDVGRPFFERSVYYDELSPDGVDALRGRAEKLSMDVLLEINRRGMALEREDPPAPGKRPRRTAFPFVMIWRKRLLMRLPALAAERVWQPARIPALHSLLPPR